MKASLKLKWVVYGASLGLFAGTSFAQSSSASGTAAHTSDYTHRNSTSEDVFDAENVIGKDVKNNQGQDLGDIKDVVFNPQTGETFAAIGVGHDRCALAPWQALKIGNSASGKEEFTLNTTKQALEAGPTVTGKQWQQLDNSSFSENIYKQYNLQRPTRMGGVGVGALGGTSTSYGSATTKK